MSKWVSLGEGIFKSSDYLNHHGKGRKITNAEFYGVDPNIERTDYLLDNGDGTHHHYSIDVNGNFHDWGDHPNRRGDK